MTQHVESPMVLAGTGFSCPVVVGSPGHCPCENLKSYKRKEKQTNEKTNMQMSKMAKPKGYLDPSSNGWEH